jgi:hypothetical protein
MTTKKITKSSRSEGLLEQGDPADAIFYIQKGSSPLFPNRAKKRSSLILGEGEFFGEGSWPDSPRAWQAHPRYRMHSHETGEGGSGQTSNSTEGFAERDCSDGHPFAFC